MVKRFFLSVVCINSLLASFSAQCQKHQIDSLTEVLDHVSNTEKFDALIHLTKVSAKTDNQRALEFAEQARNLALNEGDSLHIVTSSRLVGQLFNRLSRYRDAEATLLQILPVAERTGPRHDYKVILGNLAVSYTFQVKYDKALGFNFEALRLQRADADTSELGHLLGNIGVVYYKLRDYERSLEYFNEALLLRQKARINESVDQTLMNASLAYANLRDFTNAKIFADSALTICAAGCTEEIIMQYEYNQGSINYELKQFDAAEQYFLKSYAIARKINPRFQMDNIIYLAKIYTQRGKDSLALKYLREAEAIDEPFNVERIKVYEEFIQLYRKRNDIQKLTTYQLKYIKVKDSTFREEMTINLMKAETKFLELENKARIQSQTQLLVLKEQSINNQRLSIGLMFGAATILLVIVMMLVRNFMRKMAANKLLTVRIDERTKEIKGNHAVLREMIRTQDEVLMETGRFIQSSLEHIHNKCESMAKFTDAADTHEYIIRLVDLTQITRWKLQALITESNGLSDLKTEPGLKR
jgi:tetratricopeptide (TPR) repeat protein